MKRYYCNGKKDFCVQETHDPTCRRCKYFDGSGGEVREIPEPVNPYWDRITTIANRQREKGKRKYSMVLEENNATALERINHLEEELIDGLMYCEWIKDLLRKENGNGKEA